MSGIEREILKTLQELDATAKLMRTAFPKPDLLPIFARIEDLTRQLPQGTSPDLRHYLQKKSYEKARLFLEGRDAENARGGCDR